MTEKVNVQDQTLLVAMKKDGDGIVSDYEMRDENGDGIFPSADNDSSLKTLSKLDLKSILKNKTK